MIKLENLYLRSLGVGLGESLRETQEIAKLIEIYSVGDLLVLMEKHPEFNWDYARKQIARLEKSVARSNASGKEAEIYIPRAYSDQRLLTTDKEVSATDLIVQSPTTEIQTTFKALRGKTIADVKNDIVLTDSKGINSIRVGYRNIGSDALARIASALDLYVDQVERQAKLYDDWSDNLFYKDYLEKEQIVRDLYSNIILFFVYNSKVKTVWGDLSDDQKKLIISSAINDNKIDGIIRKRLINDFALYTTLPELEDLSNGKQKVLNRFLVK